MAGEGNVGSGAISAATRACGGIKLDYSTQATAKGQQVGGAERFGAGAERVVDRRSVCERALVRGADWIVGQAQVRGAAQTFENPSRYPHGDYTGAMRTEYDTTTGIWSINGPVFHTGQAIRALLVAEARTDDARYREAALIGGEFLLRERIDEAGHPQRGLLKSLEQNDDEINVQVTVEALSGLLDLHQATGEARWLEAAVESVDILIRDAYLPAERLMRDHFSLRARGFVGDADNDLPGRAMLDDAVLARLADLTGENRYRRMFLEMADRLLAEEGPEGTWLRFPPWTPSAGRIHNRKNWWWGWPLLAAFDATGEQRYFAGAVRAADWYLNAQNLDGGLYYTPGPDGRHNSFGLCTSVVAVAVLFWCDLLRRTGDGRYVEPIRRGVGYLLAAQFRDDLADPNVRGALMESPKPPDGTLAPGFRVRDIASIFAIRAFDSVLDLPELLVAGDGWIDTSMQW